MSVGGWHLPDVGAQTRLRQTRSGRLPGIADQIDGDLNSAAEFVACCPAVVIELE